MNRILVNRTKSFGMKFMLACGIAVASALLPWGLAGRAAASPHILERSVSGVRITLGEVGRRWTLVPTLLDGHVESFLALREETPFGENLSAVWYRKVETTDGSEEWQSKAWIEQSQPKAVRAVKDALSLPDSTDESWPVAVAAMEAAAPEQLAKGLLESDPLAPMVAELADPQPLVEMLEDAGWKAAWIGPLEGVTMSCSQPMVLASLAVAVEASISANEDSDAIVVLSAPCTPSSMIVLSPERGEPAEGANVSRTQLKVGGWSWLPILSPGGRKVESILALIEPGRERGENIRAVWFQRDPSGWRSLAWPSGTSQASAAAFVMQQVGIAEASRRFWLVEANAPDAEEPVQFLQAVFVDDPMLAQIESSPDPRSFVESLVDAGYPAADPGLPIVGAAISSCSTAVVLDAVADGIELGLVWGEGREAEALSSSLTGLSIVGCAMPCWDWDEILVWPTCTACAASWTLCGTGSSDCPAGYASQPASDGLRDLAQCSVLCWFEGTLNCSWTQTVMTHNWDCTTCTWNQTGTSTDTIYSKSTTYFVGPTGCNWPPPPAWSCPTSPDKPNPTCGSTHQTQSPGGWTPPSPCD